MGQISDGLSNIGSAFTNGNTFSPDPSGFSGGEWAARIMGGAGKGALQGLGNMSQKPQQPTGQQMQVPMPQQPQVNLPQGMPGQGDKNNKLFYGQ